jgi:hypothetical protein
MPKQNRNDPDGFRRNHMEQLTGSSHKMRGTVPMFGKPWRRDRPRTVGDGEQDHGNVATLERLSSEVEIFREAGMTES